MNRTTLNNFLKVIKSKFVMMSYKDNFINIYFLAKDHYHVQNLGQCFKIEGLSYPQVHIVISRFKSHINY